MQLHVHVFVCTRVAVILCVCVCVCVPPQQGSSNEYPQSIFLSRNKKNYVYSCKPQFYYMKVGFKGVNIIKACFRDDGKKSSKCIQIS